MDRMYSTAVGYAMPTKERLLNLQKKLKTDQAIADKLWISRQTVTRWRKKYGIKSLRDLVESRNYKIEKLFQGGLTKKELSRRFKLSISQINRIL